MLTMSQCHYIEGWKVPKFLVLFVRLSFLLYVNKMRGMLGMKFTEAAVERSQTNE